MSNPPAFILWLTGLSGAGKTTLGTAFRASLGARRSELLDGDEVRLFLSRGLGFSRADRDTHVHRIGYVARLLARNGVPAIVSAISPYRSTRAEVRALAEKEGIRFVETFVTAELPVLIERDPKGLYKKALAGELQHFTGVSDPYEPPADPDILLRTDAQPVAESLAQLRSALSQRGLL